MWLDGDLACRPVSSAQSDSDLTGWLVCVVVYLFPGSIDPRQNSSQWSVCGRFSVALYTTVGLYLSGQGAITEEMIRQHVPAIYLSVNNSVSVNILLVVNCIPKPLITIVAVSPSMPAPCVSFLPFSVPIFSFLFICLATNLMSESLLFPHPLSFSPSPSFSTFFRSACLFHFFVASPSLLMLSLAFEAASFVPDSHSSDWDILGFKVTQTDLLS